MNPIIKFYYNHLVKKQDKKIDNFIKAYKDAKRDYENQWVFIWGLKSYDDLSPSEVNLHTMNDIDITYDREDKKYHLSIETIYDFDDKENGSKIYIKRLFDKMTEWMNEKGYDTSCKPNLWEVFTDFLGEHDGFDSIEELYGSFKFLVEKYIEESK